MNLLLFIFSVAIFGTIGVFRKFIPLPSGLICLSRGIIGSLFLLVYLRLKGTRLSRQAVRKNSALLIPAGILLGLNWILIFEAYRYTKVSTVSLCYYMAPVFVILASPFVTKEALTGKKAFCAVLSFTGMVLVSGILNNTAHEPSEIKGILLALASACLYAANILVCKKLKEISGPDVTIVQLLISAAMLLPYTLLFENVGKIVFTPLSLAMLLIMSVLHTGIAYTLYYSSIKELKAQTIAIFSYIDPVVAVILSVLILKEAMSAPKLIGAALILGSAMISESGGSRT